MKTYICAPFSRAEDVRRIHDKLRMRGITPTSRWADFAMGPEDLPALRRAEKSLIAAGNDADLLSADAVIVMGVPGEGGEMFAEARLAIHCGIPVYWFGREILSASRPGVIVCNNEDEAIAHAEMSWWPVRVMFSAFGRLDRFLAAYHRARKIFFLS